MTPGIWRFTLRQMSQRSSIRILTAYSWAIAATGFAFVLIACSKGHARASDARWFAFNVVDSALFAYLSGVSVALVAIAGAILVHSPLPAKPNPLLDTFSLRLFCRPFGQNVHPLHGALVVARLAAIVPSSLAIGLLLNSRKSATISHLFGLMLRFLSGTLLVAAVCGFFAVWLGGKQRRFPLLTWTAIWLVPEGLRVFDSSVPTCRSLLFGFLGALTQPWGAS